MISSPPNSPVPALPPESERLAVLHSYEVLDSAAEKSFDRLVELAAQIFRAPMAALSLVDSERQWFKARVGMEPRETRRDISFCTHAIRQATPLIVPDAMLHPLFADSPLVTGTPHVRFYIGAPLLSPTGHALGALCVLDSCPRLDLDSAQVEMLQSLAELAMHLLEQRRIIRHQRQAESERVRLRFERDELAATGVAREARFRAILDALPVATYTCDAAGLITYYNSRAVEAWGRTPALRAESERYTGGLRLFTPEGEPVQPAECWMARALQDAQPMLGREVLFERPDGSRRHFLAHASPLFADGQLTGAVNVLIDITELKAAEYSLRRAEAMFEAAARAGRVGLWEWDLRTNHLTWSRVHADLWEIDPAQFRGTIEEFTERVHPDDRAGLWQAVQEALAGGRDYDHEYRVVTRLGGTRWILGRGTHQLDTSGQPIRMTGIVTDITEKKTDRLELDRLLRDSEAARVALAASEQRYRLLFENHPHPLWVYDIATLRFLSVNNAAVEHYGYAREEFLAMTIADIRAPEDVPALHASVARAAGRPGSVDHAGEWRHRRRDGTEITVEITSHPLELATGQAELVLALDVTEKRALQDQFLRAQRMENLGLLAAGIAHDLNNILTPMMMIAPLLGRRLTSETDQRLLATVEQSVRRGAGLVKQITGFARGAGTELVPVQVKHLARDVAAMIRETFPRSIRFVPDIATDLPAARANPTQVHQVMLNLCVNARDAMPEGGELRLNVCSCQLDDSAAPAIPDARAGSFVLIEVSDTGTGIPPEVLERMWEPFYTTKPEGKGTGLGLSTVRGIVARHDGFVTVETAPGRGTSFRVYLPVDTDARDAANSVPPTETPRGTGECILFVDDEQEIRVFAQAALVQHGFRVLVANGAPQALELFRAHKDEVRLVITDHHMPGLKGHELIAALRVIQPHLPALICSGSSGREWPGLSKEEMLLKPFEPATLLAAIRQLLR